MSIFQLLFKDDDRNKVDENIILTPVWNEYFESWTDGLLQVIPGSYFSQLG